MTNNTSLIAMTPEMKEQIQSFKEEWHGIYAEISKEQTPQFDGAGKKIIDTRRDGYQYIEEYYMRATLDKHFPGWSWESAAPLHFLGAEWVVAQGHLIIIDEHLLAWNVNPPIRKFYGADSVRIQYTRNQPHTPDNIVDVGDSCKQAITAALKYAINRLTRIGDDIYGKRIDMEGAGSLTTLFEKNPDSARFLELAKTEFGITLPTKLWSLLSGLTGQTILSNKDIESKIGWKEAYELLAQNMATKGGDKARV